jgi:hypothetical protein
MSTLPAVTMQDFELEQAEMLPDRETLCCGGGGMNTTNVGVSGGLAAVGPVLSGNAVSVFGPPVGGGNA